MTITEKILAARSGVRSVEPGDYVEIEPDVIVLLDTTFTFPEARSIRSVRDPSRIVIVFDHLGPPNNIAAAETHRAGREFARRFGIERVHDLGLQQGIVHQIIEDNRYQQPGGILVCADSHTCSVGAFNALGRGVGTLDVLQAVCLGKTWFQCGESIKYFLGGTLRDLCFPKDVFLHIAGQYGAHTNQNVEFHGALIESWSITERRSLATMCAEIGAEFSVFPFDQELSCYFSAAGLHADDRAVAPDSGAVYRAERTVDASRIEPMVALPHRVVNNVAPARTVAAHEVPVDQCFVGSCSNGTIDDLRAAAEVVYGKHVHDGVRFIVTPSSEAVHRKALELGYIATLLEAGAVVTTSTCGACAGLGSGVLAAGERAITSSTRNFRGRMGSGTSEVYMGSSATVAASALAGKIVDPRDIVA